MFLLMCVYISIVKLVYVHRAHVYAYMEVKYWITKFYWKDLFYFITILRISTTEKQGSMNQKCFVTNLTFLETHTGCEELKDRIYFYLEQKEMTASKSILKSKMCSVVLPQHPGKSWYPINADCISKCCRLLP